MSDDDLITMTEAAALAGRTYETVRRAVADGRIPRVRVRELRKGGWAVRRADVLALWSPREPPRCDVCGKPVSGPGRRHRRCASTPPGWLTIRDAAAILGCSFQNVNQLIRWGTLPDLRPETVEAYKSGVRWRRFERGGRGGRLGLPGRPRKAKPDPEPWQLWDGT